MIQVRYAKSAMEQEEGMNHLWIQPNPPESAERMRVRIVLPPGLHRSRNLNMLEEDSSGEVMIPEPASAADLFIEVFTREPVACGEYRITVEMCYYEKSGAATVIKQIYPLKVVSEEEADDIQTDGEVVRRIKELQLPAGEGEPKEFIEYTQAKLIRLDSRQVSEWEKQYRVEGIMKML